MINFSFLSSSRSSTVDTDSMEQRQSVVRFEISQDETSSPSDSNNSNNSSVGGLSLGSGSYTPEILYFEDERVDRLDFYLVEFDRHAYRHVCLFLLLFLKIAIDILITLT